MSEIVREITELKTNASLRNVMGISDNALRNSKHFGMDNGNIGVLFQETLHIKNDDGTYSDADPTVVSLGGATLDNDTGEQFTHCCEKANVRVWFNEYDKPIKLRPEVGQNILIQPVGANKVTGTVKDNKITYARAYNDVDIIREMTPEGLKNWAKVYPGHETEFVFNVPVGLEELKKYYSPGYVQNPNDRDDTRPCTVEWIPTGYIWRLPDLAGLEYPILIDDEVTIQGAGTTTDAVLRNTSPDMVFDTDALSHIGDVSGAGSVADRIVIKFDVSVVPSDATVTASVLSLFMNREMSDTTADATAYRVLRNWVITEVTWNSWSSGNSWTTAGAGSAGNDRAAAASAVRSMTATETEDVFKDWSGAQLTTDTQNFVDGGQTNNGWLIECPGKENQGASQNWHEFNTSDHATAAQRPKLFVEYTPAPTGIIPLIQHHRQQQGAR